MHMPARPQDWLRRELRTLVTPGRRMADELECVASVMLAILIAHLIGAQMIAWAAFSAFVLMKGPIGETILRAVLRMIGTLLGATLAIWAIRLSPGYLWLDMAMTAAVGGASLYGTLAAKRSYAFLLFGLTFQMILLDRLEHPAIDIGALALTRVLEVLAGTLACLAVSLIATLTARRLWPAEPLPKPPKLGWHPPAALHAAQAALALALLPLIHALAGVGELAQAAVTIMAVMIVPVAGLADGALEPVGRRLLHRALGCLAGGALGLAILLVSDGHPGVLIAGTCLGIVIGRHIENASARVAYLGLQFTLAILVVLVPDDYSAPAIDPGLKRLLSVFIGMAVLLPILLVWRLLIPRRAAKNLPSEAPSSE
jgi:uncharacterized membrane protein YccC